MRICRRADCRIADRRRVYGKQSALAEPEVVERGNLHEEIVGMLAVSDWYAVGRLALLEEERIALVTDGRGLETHHHARGEDSAAGFALGHGHEPVRGEELVPAAR